MMSSCAGDALTPIEQGLLATMTATIIFMIEWNICLVAGLTAAS